MYDTIKNFERQASRLKEQKAREKLEAREAEFKQTLAKKRKVRRKEKTKTREGAEEDGDESPVDDDSDIASEEEEDDQTLEQRRAAKLDKLRSEVESKQQAMVEQESKEASMRDQLLATNESEIGPTLKRRKLQERSDEGSNLLTSLMKAQTPPHDFSKSLGLTSFKGKVLFPSIPEESRWTPPETAMNPNDKAFLVELNNFEIGEASNGKGNNTVAIKFNAPGDSKRFRCVLLVVCWRRAGRLELT